MDKLLAKLSEQSAALSKQQEALKSSDDNIAYSRTVEYVSAASSVPITPAGESFNNSTAPTTNTPSIAGDDAAQPSAEEVLRLKLELEAAKGKIARMDQELAQTRITKHTIDQAIGTPSEADFSMGLAGHSEVSDIRLNLLQQSLNTNARPQVQRDNSWAAQEDSRSDTSDALSAGGFNRARAIWGNGDKPSLAAMQAGFQPSEALASTQWMNRGFGQPFVDNPMAFPSPQLSGFRGDRMLPDADLLMAPPGGRRPNAGGRFNNRAVGSFPYSGSNSSYDGYNPSSSTPYGSVGAMSGGASGIATPLGMNMLGTGGLSGGMAGGMGGGMYSGYQPQPIGTPLSPHAPEFTSSGTQWKSEVSSTSRCHSVSH